MAFSEDRRGRPPLESMLAVERGLPRCRRRLFLSPDDLQREMQQTRHGEHQMDETSVQNRQQGASMPSCPVTMVVLCLLGWRGSTGVRKSNTVDVGILLARVRYIVRTMTITGCATGRSRVCPAIESKYCTHRRPFLLWKMVQVWRSTLRRAVVNQQRSMALKIANFQRTIYAPSRTG